MAPTQHVRVIFGTGAANRDRRHQLGPRVWLTLIDRTTPSKDIELLVLRHTPSSDGSPQMSPVGVTADEAGRLLISSRQPRTRRATYGATPARGCVRPTRRLLQSLDPVGFHRTPHILLTSDDRRSTAAGNDCRRVAAVASRTYTDAGRSPVGASPPGCRARPTSGPVQAGRDARLDGSPTLLELATQTHPHGEMLVVATGEIDLSGAPTLLATLHNALRHPSCRTLITDLRGVQFLGARGITVLLIIQHTADTHDVRLALVADHQAVLRPLQITATTDRLTMFPWITGEPPTAAELEWAEFSETAVLTRLNQVMRGWTNYFRHAACKRTLSRLFHFVWWRMIRWLRTLHRWTWTDVRRRFTTPDGRWKPITVDGVALFNPASTPITRYRYRGTTIPNPWTSPTTA